MIRCDEFFGIYLREKTFEQTLNPMTAVMNAIQLELLPAKVPFPGWKYGWNWKNEGKKTGLGFDI